MLKFFAAFFIFLFSVTAPSAQTGNSRFNIIKGTVSDGKKSSLECVVGATTDGVILCRYQKKDLYLELVDNKANTVKSVLISDMKHQKLKKSFVGAFLTKGKLFLRFSAHNKRGGKAFGFIDEYDPKTLQFISNVSMESVDVEGMTRAYWYGIGLNDAISEVSESGFYVSTDKNYVVEFCGSFEKDKSTAESTSMRVFDSNMKMVWEKDFVVPYSKELFELSEVLVDDNGNIHLLGREYFDKIHTKRKGKPNYKYHVFSFIKNGTVIKDNVLEIASCFITDASVGISPDGLLIVCGFYGSVSSFSIDGSFSLKVNIEDQKTISTSKKEFAKDFIQLGYYDPDAEKYIQHDKTGKDFEIPHFNLDHMVLLEDGGWMLLAERFYSSNSIITSVSANGSMSSYGMQLVNFDDVIVVRINAAGEIQWNTKITKHQSWQASGETMLSYAWGVCNGSTIILYNTSAGLRNNIINTTVITPDGAAFQETSLLGAKSGLAIHPAFCERTQECQILLYITEENTYFPTYQFRLLNW